MIIEFKEFPTHVKASSKKYIKINTQNLYNQNLNHFTRSSAIKQMKDEFTKVIPKKLKMSDLPVVMFIEYYAPYNYGDVRRYKGNVSWKELTIDNYEPSNDLDNMVFIWSKVIQDCIVKSKIIPEDTIQFVKALFYKYKQVQTLNERKLVVHIIPVSELNTIFNKVAISDVLNGEELFLLNILLRYE